MNKINPFKLLIDLVLLIIAFLLTFFIKRGHLAIEPAYLSALPLLVFLWLLTGLFTSKFSERNDGRIEPYSFAALYLVGILSLVIYGFELQNLSRLIIFGTVSIYLLLEIFIMSGRFLPLFADKKEPGERYSLLLIAAPVVTITAAFFLLHYIKLNRFAVESDDYVYILLAIYFLWFFTALFTHKFVVGTGKNFFAMVLPFIRSYFIILSVISAVIYGFRIEGSISRLLILGTVIAYAAVELIILFSIFMLRYVQKSDIPEITVFEAPLLHEELVIKGVVKRELVKAEKYALPGKIKGSGLFREKLATVYMKNLPEVLAFIDGSVDLGTVDIVRSEVMDTGNPYNVEVLPDASLEMLINIHELNSFRYLNKYLISVNRVLGPGGVFCGRFEPMERRYIYFRNKYPAFFARIFYFLDFIWKRVFPKMPVLNKFYFLVTKGRDRVFSMAQGLGRLYYCGFEVISLKEMDHFVWFTVNKVKDPLDTTPSYAFFFKQKRVGKGGKPIYIYKVRTMHPFSEFIHQYVYERNKLDEKGKIKDDFRITSWGRVFRKMWIDELPMIVNWLKRDLKLVGVRPLSETFFETYPKDLKKSRIKSKPGLIPPYYADMPGSIEDVWESERKYLEAYEKRPRRTDWKYFWRAFRNIVFRGAKSS